MQAEPGPEADAEAWQAHCRNVVAIVEGTVVDETEIKQENAEFARVVRLRIFGLIVINLAVWVAVAVVEDAVFRALLGCIGSLVAISSGCWYLVWQKQIRARAPPPPLPPVPGPVAPPPEARHQGLSQS
jgi:hypothetical protein